MDWNLSTAARTLCQEARGEPQDGQTAVAHVINNRLNSGKWGRSLSAVCLSRAQFSGWYSPRGNPPVNDPNFAYACGLRDDDPMLLHMAAIMKDVLTADTDPTNGSTHYHAASMNPKPAWTAGATFCGKFGNQLFYKDVK
jgi:spore germination cell wall hydrolase CwlJ-like protein